MKAYVDSSVILRILFSEKKALKLPKNIQFYAASEILKIECFRTLDRIKHSFSISDDEISDKHASLYKILNTLYIIKLSDPIIQRACESFPISLKSLDAIHLATSILWRQQENEKILFLTHDVQLSKSALASGFEVLGV
jgi:hypothetical protein